MLNEVYSKIRYLPYMIKITIIILLAILMIQVFRPVPLFITLSLFAFFELYFIVRPRLIAIKIESMTIKLTYYQYLKKNEIISNIDNCKIKKGYEISFRSSEKKFTLYVKMKNKKFEVNRLIGFDGEELEEFYESYLKNLHGGIEKVE
jgi:hypothetical protein